MSFFNYLYDLHSNDYNFTRVMSSVNLHFSHWGINFIIFFYFNVSHNAVISTASSYYSLTKETCCFKLKHWRRHYLHMQHEGVIRLTVPFWLGEYFLMSPLDNYSKPIMLQDILTDSFLSCFQFLYFQYNMFTVLDFMHIFWTPCL